MILDALSNPVTRPRFQTAAAVATVLAFGAVAVAEASGHPAPVPELTMLTLTALAALGGVWVGIEACVLALVYSLAFLPTQPFHFTFTTEAWWQFVAIFVTTHVAAFPIGLATDSLVRRAREAARVAEVQRIQELEAHKSTFISAVSHELKSPLTAIFGYTEFMTQGHGGEALTASQGEQLAQIVRGARRLDRLIEDLLDFARMDAGTFRIRRARMDLLATVQETIAAYAPQALDADISLSATIDAAEMPMDGDAQRLAQVLANLVGNALKFTEPGGRVVVRAAAVGQRWRVEVEDDGLGIQAADLPRLFKRFSQLEAGQAQGGTGLGLNIAKSIVEAHEGAIGVESIPTVRTVFWFEVPMGAPAAATATVPATSASLG